MRIKTSIAFPILIGCLVLIELLQALLSLPLSVKRPEGFSTVGLCQSLEPNAEDLTETDINDMVQSAIENAGGLKSRIKTGSTVLIKVNLVDDMGGRLPQEVNGITVDWRVARAVVRQVLAAGAGSVYIFEGSLQSTTKMFKSMGYDRITELAPDHFIALEEDIKTKGKIDWSKLKKVQIRRGLITRTYYVDRRLVDADAIISVAVLKTHRRVAVTGTVKSIGVGCYPAPLSPNPMLEKYYPNDRGWSIDHRPDRISQWISDYYPLFPVKFGIIDGLQGAQNGPLPTDANGPYRMNMRLILAGADPVAVDTVGALVMGMNPNSAPYLKNLARQGIGINDPGRIRVNGGSVAKVRRFFQSLYGDSIPQHRSLTIRIVSKKRTPQGTEIHFQPISSVKLARIELLIDGSPAKYYPARVTKILIPHHYSGAYAVIRAYNIYLDETQAEVGAVE